MKHTDHPNWKNLSSVDKANVRKSNWKKHNLKQEIDKLENVILEMKEDNKSTFLMENILKRKKYSLKNNPSNEGDIHQNFEDNIRNIIKDYIHNKKMDLI